MPRITVSLLLVLFVPCVLPAADPPPPEGVLPAGADGKPLNFDFETGTLKDWTATGDAFKNQPIKGDTVYPRRNDMKSEHQGQYWIGTYERAGDKPQGTLTSVPFKVTHPWASFLVAGGPWPETCVELVRKNTNEVFSRTSGLEEENLRRVAVDLRPLMGKDIFIRVVDRHSGHWGHINFDEFRFHSEKPIVPARTAVQAPPPADTYKYAGLTPQKAAEAMTVPPGFEVKLFAGEPDVMQPIAMCLDDRGRVWVAEAFIYPQRHRTPGFMLPENERAKGDRIVIFEDTDGDGHFDKKTVFMEGLNLVSGLEVGFGGVWIGAAPYLLYVPMKDDKPSGPVQVLLDGWHHEDTHETLNTFTWGPDGWLYGCHGVFTHSLVGKPGDPPDKRTPINAGVWRYHPTKHVFEVFAQGTSNPWGLDFNDYGQMFIEACVIPHCFHIIQGGRYLRQAGNHFNPYTYADINTIADHLHYVGATPHSGNNRSDSAGGGHAHCGTMIYLGGAWPAEYRNQMFMGNIHGRRINMDILKPKGSGYVASHGKDFLLANDEWARFINMRYGPDGNVYLIDWYDKQACHLPQPEVWDRTNGRIYKICYRGTKAVAGIDLQKCTDEELVQYQLNDNDWYVRHARRILQERAAAKKPAFSKAQVPLEYIAMTHKEESKRLRAIWAVSALEPIVTDQFLNHVLTDPSEHVRAWSIRVMLENGFEADKWMTKFLSIAKGDKSPVVRCAIASAIMRLPVNHYRWDFVSALVSHGEDASDHNLPLMYWYATEPLAGEDAARALDLAANAKIPILLPFMIRRVGSAATAEAVNLIVERLSRAANRDLQLTYVRGLNEALKGRRRVALPTAWSETYAKLSTSEDADVRNEARSLAVTFGDARALTELRKILADSHASATVRQNALAALLGAGDKDLPPALQTLVAEPSLRGPAIRGLASYDDPKTPDVLLKNYGSLNAAEKRDAVSTLSSRVNYGKALLDAVASKKVPAADVSADAVRQLRNLKNAELDKHIADVWGIVRSTPADKARLMAQYKKLLTAPYQQPRDLALGRAIYAKTCQQCHTLFGQGNKVGPDITGANRGNLDYLLENILDPSAVIPKEYAATILELKNGRVITGIIREQTPAAYTVLTATETLTIPRGDVETLTPSNISMMPEDQLKPMTDAEVRALFAYLQSPTQTPMLATAENVKDFFNGKDLTGWDGDPKLWSVENGEIVGKSPGIKHNEFLKSHLTASDFRLMLKVRLVPNAGNSGVQFRSVPLPDGEMKGPQADIGAGWWGKLYDESGRGVISDKSGEPFVKVNDWNDYEIIAVGSKIKTFINGKPCVDLDDPAGSKRGIFGLQIHAGEAMEVRFKEMRLEVLSEAQSAR